VDPKKFVKWVGVILIVFAVMSLIPNLLILFSSSFKEIMIEDGYNPDYPFEIFALTKLVVAIIMVIGAVGFLKFMSWGRQLTMLALLLFLIVYAIDSWFTMKFGVYHIPLLLLFTIAVIPIYYLSRKNVLHLFPKS
jgi:hypothetical protein